YLRASSCFNLVLYCFGLHRCLHSFPTRRSSDLGVAIMGTSSVPVNISFTGPDASGVLNDLPPMVAIGLEFAPLVAINGTNQNKLDRKSTRLNSSHGSISYAVFCLKKKKTTKLTC